MKKLLWLSFIVALLQAGVTTAAPVTIDFDGDYNGGNGAIDVPQGFTFESPNFLVINTIGGTGNGYIAAGDSGGPPDLTPLMMRQSSGLAFSLLSADIDFCSFPFSCSANPSIITGYDSNGQIIAQQTTPGVYGTWTTVSFDGAWSNVHAVTFSVNVSQVGTASVALDNIVVDVVPIPAAAWLFGSGLMALGWLRRKQST